MPIDVPPSNNTDALISAIQAASEKGEAVRLLSGTHLTKPGYRLLTPIGPKGLVMSGPKPGPLVPPARIQRPDRSIGIDPPGRTDDNFGIFLIPSAPTKAELAGIEWLTFQPKTGAPFEYGIVIRGDIRISSVTVDCNMGNQGLEGLSKDKDEHSAMLGFSGFTYEAPNGPQGQKRQVFVGFNSVVLTDITLERGGFADDIWFPPGYFRPNIGLVQLTRIVSQRRVNPRRASVGFSGLTQRVTMKDCNLDTLHLELDEDWSTFPGPKVGIAPKFQPSVWSLSRITARGMAFAAKGAVQTLTAANLNVTETFQVHFAAGSISNSQLALSVVDRRLFGLRSFLFSNCVWNLAQEAGGVVPGLVLSANFARPFSATFRNNTFSTAGGFQSGQLINTGDHTTDAANQINATFNRCRYQPGFATPQSPNTHVGRLQQQGNYTFLKADLAGRDPSQLFVLNPHAQQIDQGTTVLYHIP